ncbi:MAG TPA: UPF0058 family protein [Candidatus Thermoplasmatota archaeon]|nr:UPF0058 family protein [Candidatus Thermoplasmatota archaeon]
MHKDELIQMHTLLCQLKNHFQAQGRGISGAFDQYESLGVTPLHVHRSKTDHKRAIFLLGKELAGMVSTDDLSNPARVGARMGHLVHKLEKPMMRP